MAESMEEQRNRVASQVLTKESAPGLPRRDQPLADTVGKGLAVLMDDMGVSESELNEFMQQQTGKPDIRLAAEQLMRKKVAEQYPDYSQERIDSLFSDLDARSGRAFRSGESMTAEIGRDVKRDSGDFDSTKMFEGQDISRDEYPISGLRKQAKTEAVMQANEDASDDDQGMKTEQSAVPSSYKDRLNQMFQVYK